MQEVMTAASKLFNWLFVTTTGTNAHTAAIEQLVTLVTSNDFLLIGLSCMVCGFVLSIIRKLIAST